MNFKFFTLVLFVLTFQACQETDDVMYEENIELTSIELYNKVLNHEKPSYYFSTLTVNQKALVWQGKYMDYLNSKPLNFEQKEFVEKLKNKMTVSLFSNPSSDSYSNLFIEATKIFEPNQAVSLFYTLENDMPESQSEDRRFFGQEFTAASGASCGWIEVSPNVFEYGIQGTYTSYAFWIATSSTPGWYPCDYLGGD